MRAPRGTRPNSDDDDDDDDDDVRLTSQSRASVEAGHPDRDGHPSAPASQPKVDNASVPTAAAAAGAGTPNPIVPFSLSLILRNTGSVARDHLASERTFLAYVRTSLSFASAGVGPSHPSPPLPLSKKFHIALVQLFRVSVSSSTSHDQLVVSSYARPLGATLIAFGMAVLVMGESRHVSSALPSHPFSSPHAHIRIYADDTT
jgi:uncharacterized membrane protein YidH (DUF202 family)